MAFGIDQIGKQALKGEYHKRRRRRNQETAGPYRGQSSVPSIRKEAHPYREHHETTARPTKFSYRAANRRLASSPLLPSSPFVEPPKLNRTTHLGTSSSTGGFDPLSAISTVADLLVPNDPTGITTKNPIRDLAEEEAKNIGEVAKANYPNVFGGKADIRHVLPHAPTNKELQAAATIFSPLPAGEADKLPSLLKLLDKGPLRRGAAKVAQKIEPEALRGARTAISRSAEEKLPASVRAAGRIGGRSASYPLKHPFTTPFALQAPFALAKGNPKALLEPLEGKGIEASIGHTLGQDIAPYGGQIAKEAVNLPASVLPSTFLIGKAGVSAAQGQPKELNDLIKQYRDTGLLPAVLEGNPSKALSALKERPLYSALEASGAISGLGRGLGAGARALTRDRIGGLQRPDLTFPGYPNEVVQRGYSRDLLRQTAQRLHDRRTNNTVDLTKRSGRRKFERATTDSARRYVANKEAIRRMNRRTREAELKEMVPKSGRGPLSKMDTASANVSKLAIERIVQDPSTFQKDLADYKHGLESAASHGELNKTELSLNQQMIAQVDKGLKRASPEHVVEAANAFIAAHKPIVDELVARGLLDPQQAAKASAFPFARIHMGAQYGVPEADAPLIAEKVSAERQLAAAYEKAIAENQSPELIASLSAAHAKAIRSLARAEQTRSQLLDPYGNPLTLEQITAEMKRRGIEPAGFISHRKASTGDFYKQPFPNRPGIPRGARTGLSAVEGTHMGGWDAVRRQLLRSQTLLDAVKTFDGFSRFVVKAKGGPVENMAEAHHILEDPAANGLDPNIKWVPFRLHGYGSTKEEMQGLLEHQADPTVAQEGFLAKAITSATDPQGPNGAIGFMPKSVFDELKGQYATTGKATRGIQGATTAYKRAVLPFSPTYHIQVPLDNWIKTGIAGINPLHMYLGRLIKGEMSPEAAASLFSGERTTSIDSLSMHRTTATILEGDRAAEAAVRAVASWRAKPGINQFANGFRKVSNSLLKFNAVVSERLPEYGAVGKQALQDFRTTQHSWVKAIWHMHQLAEEYAKGQENPATLLRTQKGIEDVLFNWTKLNPNTRRVLINVVPFYTWIKNATKFVYATMPAHRPIQTGLLTVAARMTQEEREKFGLDLLGKEPLPGWLQGEIPLAGGLSKKLSRYSSFGFFNSPAENIGSMVAPVFAGSIGDLKGTNWKGEQLGGSELSHVGLALGEFLTAFTPGFYTGEGLKTKGLSGELNPLSSYPGSEVKSLRTPHQEISVPVAGSSSSGSGSSAPWKSSSSSSGTAPWKSSTSSSGKAPWK